MGLETVELVMDIEDRFGVSLPDDECEGVRTVADLAALVISKLPKATSGCPSARSFYHIRRLFMNQLRVERKAVTPKTRLDEIGLAHNRAAWNGLSRVDPRMPARSLPGWLERVLFWSCVSGFIAILAISGLTTGFTSLGVGASLAIGIGGLLFVGYHACVRPALLASMSVMPEGIITVGDLAKRIAFFELPPGTSGRSLIAQVNVLQTIREITSQQLGLPIDKVRPESDFVRDLGCG